MLIRSRRTAVHRQLGLAALVVAAAVIATSLLATRGLALRSATAGIPPPVVIGISMQNLMSLTVFAAFLTSGALLRRQSEHHKRLMLLACTAIINPALSGTRVLGDTLNEWIPGSWPVAIMFKFAVVIGLVVVDLRTRGRLMPVTLIGGPILLASGYVADELARGPLGAALYEILAP
jgi:hypothetical protein